MRCLVIYNPAAGKKGAYRGVREQIRCYCQKEGIDLEEAVTIIICLYLGSSTPAPSNAL